MSEIELLQQLQSCDTESMRLKRELEELPEAQLIMQCRAKRKKLKGKQDDVVELADDAAAKLLALQREEEQVITKMNSLQETLDSTSDYRVTQSVTRDLQGQAKRQASIAQEQNTLLERQMNIDKLADQVADMLARVDASEDDATREFKRKGTKLKERLDVLAGTRSELVAQLRADTVAAYERVREEKNGIALSRLEDDHCSVCRTVIAVSQLAKLKRGPALAMCPNCRRLMIVREADEDV